MSIAGQAPAQARPVRQARGVTPRKALSRTGFFLFIAAFVIASLFPFYWIVATSLKTDQAVSQGTTSLLPGSRLTLGAYTFDLTQTGATGINFSQALLNSAIVALSATAITVVISVLAGYALARTRMRGKSSV